MKNSKCEPARPRFSIISLVCCTTLLLSGCNILDDSDKSNKSANLENLENLENSPELIPTELLVDLSEVQQSGSDQYKSSSTVGAIPKSEMGSEKYTLSATLTVPNQTSSK
jgi:hypothetical protein